MAVRKIKRSEIKRLDTLQIVLKEERDVYNQMEQDVPNDLIECIHRGCIVVSFTKKYGVIIRHHWCNDMGFKSHEDILKDYDILGYHNHCPVIVRRTIRKKFNITVGDYCNIKKVISKEEHIRKVGSSRYAYTVSWEHGIDGIVVESCIQQPIIYGSAWRMRFEDFGGSVLESLEFNRDIYDDCIIIEK